MFVSHHRPLLFGIVVLAARFGLHTISTGFDVLVRPPPPPSPPNPLTDPPAVLLIFSQTGRFASTVPER